MPSLPSARGRSPRTNLAEDGNGIPWRAVPSALGGRTRTMEVVAGSALVPIEDNHRTRYAGLCEVFAQGF